MYRDMNRADGNAAAFLNHLTIT